MFVVMRLCNLEPLRNIPGDLEESPRGHANATGKIYLDRPYGGRYRKPSHTVFLPVTTYPLWRNGEVA